MIYRVAAVAAINVAFLLSIVLLLRAAAPSTIGELLAANQIEVPGWLDSIHSVLSAWHFSMPVISLCGLVASIWAVMGAPPFRLDRATSRSVAASCGSAATIGLYAAARLQVVAWDTGAREMFIVWGLMVVAWSPISIVISHAIAARNDQRATR